jgi:hypothetical protein
MRAWRKARDVRQRPVSTMRLTVNGLLGFLIMSLTIGASSGQEAGPGNLPTAARSSDGQDISWAEHIIDDVTPSVEPLTGGDRLLIFFADFDGDGRLEAVAANKPAFQRARSNDSREMLLPDPNKNLVGQSPG